MATLKINALLSIEAFFLWECGLEIHQPIPGSRNVFQKHPSASFVPVVELRNRMDHRSHGGRYTLNFGGPESLRILLEQLVEHSGA